jgi:hypothetical protein
MTSIDMSNNDIFSIQDIHFYGYIENIWLDSNNIKVLENLPISLKRLYIRNNMIEKLENLPEGLEELWINNNTIKVIENLPNTLKKLYINNNQVSQILSLPQSIEVIQIFNNPLIEIPQFVMDLPNLNIFSFQEDNVVVPQNFKKMLRDRRNERAHIVLNQGQHNLENEILTFEQDYPTNIVLNQEQHNFEQDPANERIIDFFDDDDTLEGLPPANGRDDNDDLDIYNDSQNVHDTSIQSSLTLSINNIIKGPKMSENYLYDSICNSGLTESVITNIWKNINDITIHEATGCTYLDVLCYVFNYICESEHYDDLIKVLEQEIIDGSDLCFVGRITRLVNVLSGYHEGVNLVINDSSQIGNIAVLLKSKYSGDTLKKEFTKEMRERDFSDDIINEWLMYFD